MTRSYAGPDHPAPAPYQEPKAGMPVPMDMTDIYRYEAEMDGITKVNSLNAAYYMQAFLQAKELSSSYYCKLLFEFEQAKNKTKEAYAIAYLEKADDYLAARGLKSTEEARKNYVMLNEEYKSAKNREDALKALSTLMGNKVDKFQSAYEAVKKLYDGARDPRGSAPALATGRDSS